MDTYRSLLVGVDFTPGSAAALQNAIRLASGLGASLHAVHVIDSIVALELEEALSEFQPNLRQGLLSDARTAWSEFAASVPGAAKLPFEVTIDNRHVGIIKAVRAVNAQLLVVGAFGRKPLDIGFGSLATTLVRHSPSDVLLVRGTKAGKYRTIVACVDFSRTSGLVLQRAARIAHLDQAELHVLHVFAAPWHRLHYRAPTVEVAPQFVKQYSDGLRRRLQEFAQATIGRKPDLKFRCELFDHGAHRSGIVAYAQQVGADLIVLGTRGRTSVRDILLGSTAEKALRLTGCSVLAVKDDSLIPDNKPSPAPP